MYVPEPDIVFRPSEDLRKLLTFGRVSPKVRSSLRALSLDPSVRDIRFSLKEAFIIDNRDPGKGDIYLATIVTDNLLAEPFAVTIRTFADIHDGEQLQLGPGGLAIYRNQQGTIPRYLDYRILMVESDEELRAAGALLKEVQEDEQYKAARDTLVASATAAVPAVGLITAGADLVIGLIARILRMNRDDQLMYVAGSFDDRFDDLGVKHGLVCHKNGYAKICYQIEAA